MAVALYLMTNLRADTSPPILWIWQFIAGVGVGPTMAVFTIIVQNSVPWQQLGVATSNLTFFRQVGGTVGLAIAGTIFGSTLTAEAPDADHQLAPGGRSAVAADRRLVQPVRRQASTSTSCRASAA